MIKNTPTKKISKNKKLVFFSQRFLKKSSKKVINKRTHHWERLLFEYIILINKGASLYKLYH